MRYWHGEFLKYFESSESESDSEKEDKSKASDFKAKILPDKTKPANKKNSYLIIRRWKQR